MPPGMAPIWRQRLLSSLEGYVTHLMFSQAMKVHVYVSVKLCHITLHVLNLNCVFGLLYNRPYK